MTAHPVKVRGLPSSWDESRIRSFLAEADSTLNLVSCQIEKDVAVLGFSTSGEATRACDLLHKKKVEGTKLKAWVPEDASAAATTGARVAPSNPSPVPKVVPPSKSAPRLDETENDDSGPLRAAPTKSDVGQDKRWQPPYHFVPVEVAVAAADAPVYHDRLDVDQLRTGELRCTLTALTPLLAANDQYDLKNAASTVQDAFKRLVRNRGEHSSEVVIAQGDSNCILVQENKKVLEPLTWTTDDSEAPGPVLLGGAAIKGVIRQSLGALLSAPMERIWERRFSFRPNVKFSAKHDDLIATRVGVVRYVHPNGSIVIRPLESLNDVLYVIDAAVPALLGPLKLTTSQDVEPLLANLAHVPLGDEDGFAQQLDSLRLPDADVAGCLRSQGNRIEPGTGSAPIGGWTLLPYRFGADGDNILNAAFGRGHQNEAHRVYRWVLVSFQPPRTLITASAAVVAHWRRTLENLSDDVVGHLHGRSDLDCAEVEDVGRAVRKLLPTGHRPGDVVFFEQVKASGEIVTLGHHFRYRWRYRDTIHGTRIEEDQARHGPPVNGERLRMRSVLSPLSAEQTDGRPEKLSGARLLFGYVGTEKGTYVPDQHLTFGLGLKKNGERREPSDFSQLAGRIRINMAVEQCEGKKPEQRFLGQADQQWLVPLRALGSPKPSAVEFYLTQDRQREDAGILNTYGDTADDVAAGRLNGRKFYLHQPDAKNQPARYELCPPCAHDPPRPAEVSQQNWPDVLAWLRSQDREMLCSNQAAIGRFISRPGTEFRFTIRFSNLRPWELGALLFTLNPTAKDVVRIVDEKRKLLPRWLQEPPTPSPEGPLLAHKLGHGRPLGLGSVEIEVKEILRLVRDDSVILGLKDLTSERATLITAFADHLRRQLGEEGFSRWVECVLIRWLKVHRYAGRTRYDYPRRFQRNRRQNTVSWTIFDWHTSLRADHAGGRKRTGNAGRPQHGLQELD